MLVMLLLQWLFGKPKVEEPEASGLGDFGFPTNSESRYIPIVWGSTRINSPNVIWYGDLSTYALSTGGATVGYWYYLGIDSALCWGEVDSITGMLLDDEYFIKAGEQRAYVNGIVPSAGFLKTASGHRRISVKDMNLTGGTKNGGGIDGDISFYYGTADQPVSEYVAEALDRSGETTELANGSVVPKSALLPSYGGVSRFVWEGGYLTERATAPQFQVDLQRFPKSLTASYSVIRDDGTTADANPIHVIYEILTDTDWGLATDPLLIDKESFLSAAKKCFEEQNGFSLTIEDPAQAIKVIQDINDQVSGMLVQNAKGQFEYRLSRKTYEESTNAVLDYDKNPIGGTTYTGTGNVSATQWSDIRVDGAGFTAYVEVGDQVFLTNASESNVAKPFVVVSKNDTYDSLFLNSTSGEDLASDESFVGISVDVVMHKGPFDTVPTLTPSTIIKMSQADRQAWDQTYNTIHLTYLDRSQEFKETVANAVDSGNLAIRNGKTAIKKIDMQGIRHKDTAASVAERLLKTYSYPMTSVTLSVSRQFSYLRPGDLIEIDHPDFGLTDFYMRVLEVGLPQDTSGDVSVTGIRDIFDDPTSTVQVGGSTSLGEVESVAAVYPTNIEMTGLPQFYHSQLELNQSEATTWHILGAPNASTSSAQAYELDTGVYIDVSDPSQMPPVGKVVGHTSDVWEDRSQATRYDVNSSSVDLYTPGPYGYGPGPLTNPVRHDTNSTNHMVEGFSNDTMWCAALYGGSMSYEKGLGDIMVRDISVAMGQVEASAISEEQIKYHGFGLALIRPAWANGDSRYDEVIAFTSTKRVTLYHGVVIGPTTSETPSFLTTGTTVPALETYESYPCLSLSGVYRGLLDTGIQTLNTDSDILFLALGDPMYDRVGQNTSLLADKTYRHSVSSTGSTIFPEATVDQTVTADELKRRLRPLPPALLRVNSDTANELWGYNRYDDGRWENYNVTDVASSAMTLNWSTHDHDVSPEVLKLYSEADAVETTETLYVSLDLIDDDRLEVANAADRPDAVERNRHLLARLKEGWMPTTPPLRGGTEYTEGVDRTTLGFAASTVWDGAANGSPNANNGAVVDLTATFAAMADGTRPELTSGQDYYVEVSVQTWCTESSLLSRGAQRFGVKFTATATVTNS